MAERRSISNEVINSFHKDRAQWQLVIEGLRLGAIGVAFQGGTALAILAPATATYLPAWLIAVLTIFGILCGLTGGVLWLLGLAKCLVVPHQSSRTILLTGLIIAIYGLSDILRRAMATAMPARQPGMYTRGRSSTGRSGDFFGQFGNEFTSTILPNVVFSIAASVVVSVFLLSLATYIGNKTVKKKIHELWIVQFGGLLLVILLNFAVGYLSVQLEIPAIGAIVAIALGVAQFAFTIFLLHRVFSLTASELEKVSQRVKQKVAATKKKKKALG